MEEKLKESVFFVEANAYEQLKLWTECRASCENWVQDNMGFYLTVGFIAENKNMPVVVSFSFAWINQRRICFYYVSGRYSDSVLVEEWIDKNYPKLWDMGSRIARTDAMNFGHALNHIKNLNDGKN